MQEVLSIRSNHGICFAKYAEVNFGFVGVIKEYQKASCVNLNISNPLIKTLKKHKTQHIKQ